MLRRDTGLFRCFLVYSVVFGYQPDPPDDVTQTVALLTYGRTKGTGPIEHPALIGNGVLNIIYS